MSKILVLLLVSIFAQGCIWQKKVWNFNILSPKNNTTIQQNSMNTVTVSGNFYLEKAKLTRKDRKALKSKFYSLSIEEQNDLREKYSNADSEEKSRFWDWLFGRPNLSGNMYCNGKKGTIRQSGSNGTWYVQGVSLSEGQNTIRCAYSDKNGIKRRTVSVNYDFGSENQAPVASFDCDASEVLKLSCDASSSSDIDGSVARYIYTVNGVQTESTNPVHSFDFAEAGVKSIALVVVDDKGKQSEELSKEYNVKSLPEVIGTVGAGGGAVTLEDYISFDFSPNSFSSSTSIKLEALERNLSDPMFNLAATMIGGEVIGASYRMKISFSGDQPLNDVNILINIPNEFRNKNLLNKVPVVLFKTQSEEQPESYFAYSLDEINGQLTGTISNAYFSKYYYGSDEQWELEAIVAYINGPSSEFINTNPRQEYGGCSGIGVHKPLEETEITSGYGIRNYPGGSTFHKGIDFKATSPTPVLAAFDGVVSLSDYHVSSLGNIVAISSDKKDGGSVMYAHLSSDSVVVGQPVKAGDVIGMSGNSGLNSLGLPHVPHLHVAYSTNYFVYVKSKANKIDFESCILDPCFTATDVGYGSVDLDASCSKGVVSKYRWIYNSGQEKTSCVDTEQVSTTYGQQTATLEVTDKWGTVATTDVDFYVSPPTGDKYVAANLDSSLSIDAYVSTISAMFTASTTSGFEPLDVLFNASSSSPNLNEYIHTYRWFVNGEVNPSFESCTPEYDRAFTQGSYSVKLEVEDSNGKTAQTLPEDEVQITVFPRTGDK